MPAASWRKRRCAALFDNPAHPYTRGLLASHPAPSATERRRPCRTSPAWCPSLIEPVARLRLRRRAAPIAIECCRAVRRRSCAASRQATASPASVRRRRERCPATRCWRCEHLSKRFTMPRGLLRRTGRAARRGRRLASRSQPAKRWASSANPAAASPRWAAGAAPDRAVRPGSIADRGPRRQRPVRASRCARPPARADGVPGPLRVARSRA